MQNKTFNNLNVLEIGPLMFSKGEVKVTFKTISAIGQCYIVEGLI